MLDHAHASTLQRNILGMVLHGINDGTYTAHQSDGIGMLLIESMSVKLLAHDTLDGKGEGEPSHRDDDVANVAAAGFKVSQRLLRVCPLSFVIHGEYVMVINARLKLTMRHSHCLGNISHNEHGLR